MDALLVVTGSREYTPASQEGKDDDIVAGPAGGRYSYYRPCPFPLHSGLARVNERQYQLVKVIQKIEVFRGFDAGDVQRLLRVCHFKNLKTGEHVYVRGEPSEEMLILLRGKLRVLAESGEELALILPGMPTGEMGLFTGQPRSADIVAAAPSTSIVLRRAEIMSVLTSDKDMHIKVLSNLIVTLSQRLTDGNSLADSQARTIRELQKRVGPEEGDDDYEDDDEEGGDEDGEDEYDDDEEEEGEDG